MYQTTVTSRTDFTPPIVSLNDVKDHVYADLANTDYDSILQQCIDDALDALETGTDRLFVSSATVDYQGQCFPYQRGMLRLPLPPLITVTEIKYQDSQGVIEVIDAGEYTIYPGENGGVTPKENWPTDLDEGYPVSVTYTCGYQASENVPRLARRFILLMAGQYFKKRELQSDEQQFSQVVFEDILQRLTAGDEFLSYK